MELDACSGTPGARSCTAKVVGSIFCTSKLASIPASLSLRYLRSPKGWHRAQQLSRLPQEPPGTLPLCLYPAHNQPLSPMCRDHSESHAKAAHASLKPSLQGFFLACSMLNRAEASVLTALCKVIPSAKRCFLVL